MSTSDGKSKQTRKGPAPFASFEDVNDDVKGKSTSPDTKQTSILPQISETVFKVEEEKEEHSTHDEQSTPEHKEATVSKVRSHSLSSGANNLQTPCTPRIDISRASSSSHHDSRDSSPEMALFSGKDQAKLDSGFKEDGTLDLRSSTEELSFFEPNTATSEREVPRSPSRRSPLMMRADDKNQSNNRKDSNTSDILFIISGRSSRLSSIGSQGSAHSNVSAHSNISHISVHSHISQASGRLSNISGVSRSPSPHKMLLETSFCGPKPIETEPDLPATTPETKVLDIASLNNIIVKQDAITVENKILDQLNDIIQPEIVVHKNDTNPELDDIKKQKEIYNERKLIKCRQKTEKQTRDTDKCKRKSCSISNQSKDIIRIKLKPDYMYDDDDDDSSEKTLTNEVIQKPVSLNLTRSVPSGESASLSPTMHRLSTPNVEDNKRMKSLSPNTSPISTKRHSKKDDSRTPSPAGAPVSRKSSFCSLFKSKETVASPDSPSSSKRKSLNEGTDGTRSRSKSRDRSITPTSASKIKGSVLSLFTKSRKNSQTSASNSRDTSPVIQTVTKHVHIHVDVPKSNEKLKYYESNDGIIHIPLHTPPDEKQGTSKEFAKESVHEKNKDCSVPATSSKLKKTDKPSLVKKTVRTEVKKLERTVLPDGSILIPLHSPTEKKPPEKFEQNTIEPATEVAESSIVATEKTENKQPPTTLPIKIDESTRSTPTPAIDGKKPKKKEHVLFATSVGSKEQLFSTQLSITKTPSLTSEQSDLFSLSQDLDIKSIEQHLTLVSLPETHIGIVDEIGIDEIPAPVVKEDAAKSSFRKPKLSQTAKVFSTSNEDIQGDSSESELGSELMAMKKTVLQEFIAGNLGADEIEKKILVQDSFEEELPYVPTTLPQERSIALPIIPIKDRISTGMKMYPIERPRSTTPIHPSSIEEYLSDEARTPENIKTEKLRIHLPKEVKDVTKTTQSCSRSKSPRRSSQGNARNWCEFAEKGIPNLQTRKSQGSIKFDDDKETDMKQQTPMQKTEWINFEELPERKKMPKRIQTLPRHSDFDDSDVYCYVNPEDCKCECHESGRESVSKEDDEEPLIDDGNESVDDEALNTSNAGQKETRKPFHCDLGVKSNRSSYASQDTSADANSPSQDTSHY